MALVCPLCPVEGSQMLRFNMTDYLRHIELFHAHRPHFRLSCGISGCRRTFYNFGTFRNHISDWHRCDANPCNQEASQNDLAEVEDTGMMEGELDQDIDVTHDQPHDTLPSMIQKSSALFLMGLKEENKLTQTALQSVIEGITSLNRIRLSAMHADVSRLLCEADLSASSIPGLNELFNSEGPYGSPFLGLETQHQQLCFYKTHFQFVEPVSVTLGQRRVWKGQGSKRRCVVKDDNMIYIPLLSTLESLLHNKAVLTEVNSGHKTQSEFMEDFCDGKFYSTHPLFSLHTTALQVCFYYDELEVCNPLGSKAKIHKLGIFYFTLGNLPPKFRSKLSTIQLVAIVKTTVLAMYGMDAALQPFVNDLKELEKGFSFKLHGIRQRYYGALAIVSGDNLGSLALGGFKESCTATHPCRQCMATREAAKTQFLESNFELRNKASHKKQCAELQGDSGQAASKLYGINRNSVLNELTYFHVCSGALLPDVMHDILEGALQYEIKLMLKVMINEEEYFTLDILNSRLENIELGYMEAKDRPTPISETTMASSGVSLKQAAAQLWLFARVLPLLVGRHIPDDDERWENFKRMMEIVDRLFCPKVTEDDATYIKWLINDHHHEFCRLYPDMSVIPKMHFMVHMPRLIVQFGPLVRHWTMRYEAKHSYFKRLAQSMGNFINLPYSLAQRHQQLQCYWSANDGEIALSGLTVGPGHVIVSNQLQEKLPFPVSSAYEAKWVKVDGVEYKKNAGIVYDMSADLPKVGQITSVFVVNEITVVLELDCYSSEYIEHFRAYKLHSLKSTVTITLDNLPLVHPVHIRKVSALLQKCIILPYHVQGVLP